MLEASVLLLRHGLSGDDALLRRTFDATMTLGHGSLIAWSTTTRPDRRPAAGEAAIARPIALAALIDRHSSRMRRCRSAPFYGCALDLIAVAAAQPRSLEEAVDLTFEVVRYGLGLTLLIAVVYVVYRLVMLLRTEHAHRAAMTLFGLLFLLLVVGVTATPG